MSDPSFWSDEDRSQQTVARLQEIKGRIDPLVSFDRALAETVEYVEMAIAEQDASTLGEIREGLDDLKRRFDDLEFKALLGGEHDFSNAYLTVQAGAGGIDAADWAEMLLRMYLRFLEARGYDLAEVDRQRAEEAGIKTATIHVRGPWAYGYLRGEQGVHRLVRMSPFDAGNRRHTSFASVSVDADLGEKVAIQINRSDVRVDVYRASGAGGQHVNTTDSAVRLTHLPTGIVVQCQNERSQTRNREVAWSMLAARLHEAERRRMEEEVSRDHEEKGSNAWGNQIRSYVLAPYTLVKDKRTGYETSNAVAVLDGELWPFIESWLRSPANVVR